MYLSFGQPRYYRTPASASLRRHAPLRMEIDDGDFLDTLFTPLQILSALTNTSSATAPGYGGLRRGEKTDKNTFEVSLKVDGFKPEDLSVKLVENSVVISGSHEFQDRDGFVSRNFTRKFTLPDDVVMEQLSCNFNAVDNTMMITAPKKVPELKDQQQGRSIPINFTEGEAEKTPSANNGTEQNKNSGA